MKLLRLLRCERGVAAVEFSIVSLVFFMLIIGGIDMGRTFYVKNQLSFLADQATRAVLLDNNVSDASLTAIVQNQFTAGDSSLLSVTISTETVSGVEYRVVRVDFPMTLFIPNLSSSTFNLNVDRRVPVV